MVKTTSSTGVIVEKRFVWISGLVFLFVGAMIFRLWYIQIYKGEYYQNISQRNRLRRIEIPAPRGSIYDRYGKTVLTNRPFYDLVYVPQYIENKDTTLKILSRLLNMPVQTLETKLEKGRGRPKYFPIALKRNLSLHEVSIVESSKAFLPGIEVNIVPRRDYDFSPPAHLVGHVGELHSEKLKSIKEQDPNTDYVIGDLIGKQGLELRWEDKLKGKRGIKLIQVDAFGRKTENASKESWNLPITEAVPGNDLILTLDYELQKITEKAFHGKNGAVIVMDTRTGEILATVSAPSYPADLFQTGISSTKWRSLINDPFKPLFDKTTGGEFQPGSIYKAVVALAALQEKIITPHTKFNCNGKFELGGDVFHCHHRAGHGMVDLNRALLKSCNVFFYNVGVELGVDRIAKYAQSFGLGSKLGLNVNHESPGLIPTSDWKKQTFGRSWRLGDTPPVAVGQGANLLTPLQMVSLYASIANEGNVWKPFIVKKVVNPFGETIEETQPILERRVENILPQHFKTLKKALFDIVQDDDGTGKRARIDSHTIAGKTGSVQVVSLKKNRNQKDVSVKWREHAIFAAFSPADDAEIAVAIISQNDEVGGGGTSAAPVAKDIIAGYWNLKERRVIEEISKKNSETNSQKVKAIEKF